MYSSRLLPILCLFLFLTFQQEADAENCMKSERGDIIFLVDCSGSISAHDFKKGQDFLVSLVKLMNINARSGYRVGLVQYAWESQILLNLTDHQTVEDVVDAIVNKLTPTSYTTNMLHAYQNVYSILGRATWRGPFVARIILSLTDGRPDDLQETMKFSQTLYAHYGVTYMVIGVGDIDFETAKALAPEQHIFQVDTYSHLERLKSTLITRICGVHKNSRLNIPPPVPSMLSGIVQESDFGRSSNLTSFVDSISNDSTLLIVMGGVAILIIVLAVCAVVLFALKRRASSGSTDKNQNANLLEASGGRSGMKSDDGERNTYDQKSLDTRFGRRRTENHEQNYGGVLDKAAERVGCDVTME